MFFFSFDTKFGAVVNRRNPRKCVHQSVDYAEMVFVYYLTCNSLNIMVVGETVQFQVPVMASTHVIKTLYRVCNFKKVMLVAAGPKSFIQVIIGYRMQSFRINPACIFAMNDFAHQPEIRFYFIGNLTHSFHKIKIKNIRCVKPDAINVKFRNPEADYIVNIIFYLWIPLVQFY